MSGPFSPSSVWTAAEAAVVAGDLPTLERLLRGYPDVFREKLQSWWGNTLAPEYGADDARAIISRTHHFDSWEQFESFTRAISVPGSPVALFEAAVDAIVGGEPSILGAMLSEHPELIRARSLRNHHATLLHYVGANGVEGFRQHTPPAAVAVLGLLLSAGAEVNAVADMYGGSTTLGLVATSRHPEQAGLQDALIDVLVAHGARIDLETAAGLGRLDLLVARFEEGRLEPPVTDGTLASALGAALWSAVHRRSEADYEGVIQALIAAGARVESGCADSWAKQAPPSSAAHVRILQLLRAAEGR